MFRKEKQIEEMAGSTNINQAPPSARYNFTPFTTKNIGRNLLKLGNRRQKPHQASRECMRRLNNLPESELNREVKVTPRRNGDFEGKAWKLLRAHLTN